MTDRRPSLDGAEAVGQPKDEVEMKKPAPVKFRCAVDQSGKSTELPLWRVGGTVKDYVFSNIELERIFFNFMF